MCSYCIHWWVRFATHGANWTWSEPMPDATLAPLGDLARGSCDMEGVTLVESEILGLGEPSSFDLIGFLGSRSEDFVSSWSTCFCRLPIYFFDDWIDLGVADLFEYVWMVDCCRMMQDYFMQRRFWQSMMEFLYPEKTTGTKESFCKTDLLTRWRVYLNLFDMFREFYFASQTWWRGRKSNPLYLLE